MLILFGCIEPFEPVIGETKVSLVIDGMLTDGAYNSPEYIPEKGAFVEISNARGNRIVLPESEAGLYEQFFAQSFLETNQSYTLHIITSDGNEYISYPDTMLPCPPVETVYYKQEVRETSNPLYPINGVQIYTDLKIPEGHARNYRWEMDETWEYHAPYSIQVYYIGYIVDLGSPNDSLKKCWISNKVRKIQTITTSQIAGDKVNGIPLNYVSDESNRLKFKYSLLVKQYALSTMAYNYWNQLEKQSQESGGLYEQQPARIHDNVYNPSDPTERVLGYFNVSSVTEKRIYIEEHFPFHIHDYDCTPFAVNQWNPLYMYTAADYPIYLLIRDPYLRSYDMAGDVCFDCREGGGSTSPPDFWE
ncbi:hypothetical protein LCGC14_1814030 [marine sediment metagenome]|uniref:DUF4249 domain-containing protein n=1 Tax=marine sediment metagenome TaxID=412755 RepID=A0A0F9JKI3_9ZZZZ